MQGDPLPASYKGPNWDDWVSHANKYFSNEKQSKDKLGRDKIGRRGGEKGITDYANTNIYERFTETFTAALMTPVQLAESCPHAYDFMHKMMPSAVPERSELLAMNFPADAIFKFVDPWSKAPAADLTDAQEMLAELPEPERAPKIKALDPADPDKIGKQGNADRFYEMNHRGRTVYFRYGQEGPYAAEAKWEPSTAKRAAAKQELPKLSQIKECYDEHGNPLNPHYAYLHLVQDVIPDDKVLAKIGKTSVTMAYIKANGGLTSDDPAIKKLFDKSEGKATFHRVLRSFAKGTFTKWQKDLIALHDEREGLSSTSEGYRKLTEKIEAIQHRMEEADLGGAKNRADGDSYLPTPASMLPQEVTMTHYRLRSGAFNYDRWGVRGQDLIDKIERAAPGSDKEEALIAEFREKYPGVLALRDTRWKKGSVDPETGRKRGGQFRKGAAYFAKKAKGAKRRLAMRKMVYVNENPDGSKTRIEAVRGGDGSYRIHNAMWRELLTPNGEEIRSKEHLETLCRIAAKKNHKTWVSVRTDRKRVKKRGKWTVEDAGDLSHSLHMEVAFDGAGQPKILGNKWAKRLGEEDPRIDHLLQKDPLGDTLTWAKGRQIVPAEAITFKDETEKRSGLPNEVGDRVMLTTRTHDWKGKTDRGGRVVVARLLRMIPGKKAGDEAPAPGWDRMPEGTENLMQEYPPGIKGRLTPKMKELIGQGLLPSWFTYTPKQKEWYKNVFAPAYTNWKTNFEALKEEEYDPVYIFAGETGMGGGSNTFRRVGDADVAATTEWADSAPDPEPLNSDCLAHLHKEIDPRTGATIHSEVQLILPTDGSLNAAMLAAIPGVRLHFDDKDSDHPTRITTTLDAMPNVRASLGGLSLTGEIVELLERRTAMLKAAERQRLAEAHELELGEITPEWLINNFAAGLNSHLPNGAKFSLALHQSEGLQKLFDNDLRVLLAHYMGTGKTVTALTACKAAMARPMREGLAKGEGVPTDLVGDDRAKWLADHPFIPGTLDPRNPKRCLVVAPLNTVEQWREAAYDFDEGAIVVGAGSNDMPIDDLVAGIKDGSINPDLVVVGPQYFTIHSEKLKECGFDGLVIDEVHQGIKNEAAERNKVVNDWNPDMKMLCLLTGTPMTTSPADFVEYVRLLSKGTQWAGMDKKAFIDEYLEKTSIPGLVGAAGVSAPKIQVKPEKRAELAAILAQWMNVALPEHVQGKILPAVRIEDKKNAHMTGVQMDLYNLYMATLGVYGASGLTEEEAARVGAEARQASLAAKGVMNCIGFKPGGEEPYVQVAQQTVDKKGKVSLSNTAYYTPDPAKLFDKQHMGKNAGRWPVVAALPGGEEALAILDNYCQDVLGLPYGELAGKRIGYGMEVPGLDDQFRTKPTKKQIDKARKLMEDAGWPRKIENPDSGQMGVRFRGVSTPWNKKLSDQIDRARQRGDKKKVESLQAQLRGRGEKLMEAREFQRAYRTKLDAPPPDGGWPSEYEGSSKGILDALCGEWGITPDEGAQMIGMQPDPGVYESKLTTTDTGGYGEVTLYAERDGEPSKGDQYVSDTRGSLHRLFRVQDWDYEKKEPKSPKDSKFEDIANNETVGVSEAGLAKAGIKKPKMPKGLSPDQRDAWKKEIKEWAPPPVRLDTSIPPNSKGEIALRRTDTNDIIFVPKDQITRQIQSLLDPGKREDRVKADLMMCHGNAKANEVKAHIERFHNGSGPGKDGERQMVLFAGDILTGCRPLEAQLRLMGYRDVNEVIAGSPLHDPDDPTTKDDTGPNGKYFVTYIGSTYTGDREQNVDIFKKVKDQLGRDSKTSVFVDKCMKPRASARAKDKAGETVYIDWQAYPGDHDNGYLPDGVESVRMSQFTPEQRETAKATLGIEPPESYVMRGNEECFFYGSRVPAAMRKDLSARFGVSVGTSSAILQAIARTADPVQAKDPAQAEKLKERIRGLKAAYAELAGAGATMDPPLSSTQQTVFNNCEMIVCSDAAQVGMNLGNASEMIMYDSLGSPMAEWQRITRCARMLPAAVPEKLMGKPIMENLMVPVRNEAGEMELDEAGKPKMVAKTIINPDTGKSETVKVQKRDDRGRFMYSTKGKKKGIFDKLRDAETQLFDVENRRLPNGTVTGFKLGGAVVGSSPEAKSRNTRQAKLTLSVTDALGRVAEAANLKASTVTNRAESKKWADIAAQASLAQNQAGLAAIEQLRAFKDTKAPGSTDALIEFPDSMLFDTKPEEGTYGSTADGRDLLDTRVVETVLGNAIDALPDTERQEIMDAGFVDAQPPAVGSPDAKAVYLAMRAQEILTWMDTMRPVVTDEMRGAHGGEAVTSDEVTNRLIDTLSPTDRAILKTKKYLVNVRKIGASGAVGQVQKRSYSYEDPETGKKVRAKEPSVFTGYENEYPVRTEVRTRTLGRGRTRSNEQIMFDVQEGTEFKADTEFASITAGALSAASEIEKSRVRLVLDLRKIGDNLGIVVKGGEGSRGGKVVGHTSSGKPIYAKKAGTHPHWGKGAIDAETEKGHEHLAPEVVKHDGKAYVKASHNSDTGAVSYHEHDPDRHVIDSGTGRSFSNHREDHPHAKGGLFVVSGQPKGRGGDLPKVIDDPAHGKLSVRSHNSDTGKTHYHKQELNAGWGKSIGDNSPIVVKAADPYPCVRLSRESSEPDELAKGGGPFVGPRGGKWADAKHTIPWQGDRKRRKGIPKPEGEGWEKRVLGGRNVGWQRKHVEALPHGGTNTYYEYANAPKERTKPHPATADELGTTRSGKPIPADSEGYPDQHPSGAPKRKRRRRSHDFGGVALPEDEWAQVEAQREGSELAGSRRSKRVASSKAMRAAHPDWTEKDHLDAHKTHAQQADHHDHAEQELAYSAPDGPRGGQPKLSSGVKRAIRAHADARKHHVRMAEAHWNAGSKGKQAKRGQGHLWPYGSPRRSTAARGQTARVTAAEHKHLTKKAQGDNPDLIKAVWTTAYMNDLPDSAFLYVEPGKKDDGGKTVPRTLRHFPVRDASGKLDAAHVRNALARIPQSNVSAEAKKRAIAEAQRLLKTVNKATIRFGLPLGGAGWQ